MVNGPRLNGGGRSLRKGGHRNAAPTTSNSGIGLGVAFGYGFGCISDPDFGYSRSDLRVPLPWRDAHHYRASHLGVRIGPG